MWKYYQIYIQEVIYGMSALLYAGYLEGDMYRLLRTLLQDDAQ